MATLASIREQYPQYADMTDDALASALHQKFYSDMPRAEFDAKIGLKPATPAPQPPAAPAVPPPQQPVATQPPVAPQPIPTDDMEARLKAQAERRAQLAPGEEFVTGAKGAFKVGLPSMVENIKLSGWVDALNSAGDRIKLFDAIDRGELSRSQLRGMPGFGPQVGAYFASNPEVRQRIRAAEQQKLDKIAGSTAESLAIIDQYKKEAQKYKGRVDDPFDAENIKDFTNWVARTMGAGAVYAIPTMAAAFATKQPGLLATGLGMGYSEAVSNRLDAIAKEIQSLPPQQKAQRVADYLQQTDDVNLRVAVASGALDTVLGPAASLAKRTAQELIKGTTKKEVLKQLPKEVGKQMAEEGVAGAGQAAAQEAGKVAVGEEKEFLTPKTGKAIARGALEEAVGSVPATAGMGAVRAAAAPSAPTKPPLTEEEKIEPTMDGEWEVKSQTPIEPKQPAKKPTPPAATKAATPVKPAAPTAPGVPPAPTNYPPGIPPVDKWTAANLKATLDFQNSKPEDKRNQTLISVIQNEIARRQGTPIPEAAAPAEEAVTTEPDVSGPELDALVQKYRGMGMMRDDAERVAKNELIEKKKSETAPPPAQGETNVGQPVTEPSGAGVQVAGEPSAVPPTPGAGEAVTDGVVPAGSDVATAPQGEGIQPGAISDEQRVAEEDKKNAEFEARVEKAEQIAKTNFDAALDQVNDPLYGGDLSRALDSYYQNTIDSLAEAGEKDPYVVSRAIDSFERLANEAKQKQASVGAPAATSSAAPAGKRGRKPMAEEQKAEREQERKQDRAARNRHKRAVDKAEVQLKNALAPLDPDLESDKVAEAEEDKRANRVNAIQTLLRVSEESGLKPEGKRARKVLKDAGITDKEIADIKAGMARRAKVLADKDSVLTTREDITSAQTAPAEDKPNTAFNKVTNGAQALGVIAKTGNLFQATLANRLRAFVAGVKFIVVEQGQELPDGLKSAKMQESWEKARGMFVFNRATGERVVYVRGASFGEDNGINNTIVLHEMLHAALNQKLNLALDAIKGNYSTNSPLVREYNELIRIMNSAGKRWNELAREGKLPKRIAGMARSANIFGDPREFVAYGMSDPEFQEFLRTARGEEADTSFFNRFVNNIRKFFGMAEDEVNALSDLVVVTDKLLSSRKTAEMRIVERGQQREAQMRQANREEASNAAKKKAKKISATERKIQRSDEFQDIVEGMDDLTKLRDPNVFLDVMSAGWKSLNIKKLQATLPAIQTNVLAEWGERLGINHMKSAYQMTQDMDAMRMKMLSSASDIVKDWSTLQQGVIKRGVSRLRGMKKPDELRALANAMHYATDKRVDPTKTRSDPVMNKMWDALSPKAQEIFVRTRDHYRAMYDLYRVLLEDRLKLLKVPGKDNDPNTPRGHLMAEIKKIYEAGLKFEPYFPLMRYGDYWLRIGQGKSGEFYMFENSMQRELFLKQRIRKLQAEGDTRTEEEMRTDEFIESGNSLRGLREKSAESSALLKNVLNAIGSAQYGLTAEEVEDLKDQVYQLYLTTMPDDSFRTQFIHRKGKAGFSGDALRNFATSSVNMANQLSRIKYGPRMMMEVDMAKDSLKGNPDAEKLKMLVDEMGIRVGMQANPPLYNPLARGVANFANKSAFLYLMTSVKTALVQFASLPVFGAPVLFSRHDPAKVVKEMGRFMLVFNSVGAVDKDKDGILQWRVGDISLGNSRRVALDPEEQRAFEEMQERGIAEVTMTYDLMDRRATPSAKYVGAFNTATNAMGALFHHVERLNREVMFMTSFRLSMQEGMTFDEAIDQAVADTYDALGNFSEANRPRIMRGPVGKTLLQFKTFPAFVTTYLVRNFYRMIKPMDKQDRKEAAIQFFGTVGMSTALAGYVGIPGAAFMMGVLEGLISAFRDDEDEDPLEKKDLELWFRRVFMREMFGETKVGDVPLSEVLDSGVIDSLTGLKISDSMSMNNMWFPELKEQATSQATVSDYLLSMLGPAASIFTKRLPGAIDDFSNGRILQGFEKALPALFSNPVKAYRFSKEGALTQTGAEIKGADEFTAGQLAAQALGFRTKGLAEKQEDNFKVEAIRVKVLQEKQKLTNRLDRELELGSDESFQKALDDVVKYGWRYPPMAMKADEIQKLLERRAKARGMSDRGFRIDKKLYPHLAELLEASTETLEREAKKD